MASTGIYSNIDVLKLDQVGITKCVHSLAAPVDVVDATAGITIDQHGDLHTVVCGGQDNTTGLENMQCFSLHDQSTSALGSPRIGAASLTVDSGKTLWVTGGGDDLLLTTEYVSHQSQSSHGEQLDLDIFSLKHHCLVRAIATLTLIIGGETTQFGVDLMDLVFIMDDLTEKFLLGPSLNHARSMHACQVLRDTSGIPDDQRMIIVAAGGRIDGLDLDSWTRTVEILPLDNKVGFANQSTWALTNDLQSLLANPVSATTSDQSRMFVTGMPVQNITEEDETMWAPIFVIECSNATCQSRMLDTHLMGRASGNSSGGRGLAIMLEPSSTTIQGGIKSRFVSPEIDEGITTYMFT